MSRIVADKAIPFLEGVFEPYADVEYLPAEKIDREAVKDADAIIVRTRTICDENLLEGSKVKVVSSATIGTDHIDLKWCGSKGIIVRNAPGCNAGGVMGYVLCALYGVASRKNIDLSRKTVGIIGVGHVGGRVKMALESLGFRTVLCDPPRAAIEGPYEFCTLEELLSQSDIVTLHVPLDDSTRDMAGRVFFKKMKKGAIFINASRGEVVDEAALLEAIPHLGATIIDTWRNEPDINRALLDVVDIATPHIAGYSYQGKQNATAAAVRAVARVLGMSQLYEFYPPKDVPEAESVKLSLLGLSQGEIASMLSYNYPVFTDDFLLRINPGDFERMRKEYRYRREFYLDY
ncbi:MAG: 4-phosphoerythronate dehydrogenase [Bacteroidales bacterium]|nr:4-phosphoerythronate dehydrogenase [Bacteroidales bacterium]